MRIETATPTSAAIFAALHEIARAPHERAWSAAEFATLIAAPTAFALLARGTEPVGFALGWAPGEDAELHLIVVRTEHRRSGIGAALLRAVEAAASAKGALRMVLDVARDNEAARALYARFGYAEIGVRKRYYADGAVDALVLARALA
jgi:[ribosomal protein S18]-alanine N-acetyltransferase